MRSKQETEDLYLKYEHLVEATLYRGFSNHREFAKIHGLEVDDLKQLGKIGLLKAAETYSSSKNVQFQSYAISMIKYSIVKEAKKCSLRSKHRSTFEIVPSVSMETPIKVIDDQEISVGDTLICNTDFHLDSDMKISVDRLKKDLPERTIKIIEMRLEGYTFQEIGKVFGISGNSAMAAISRNKDLIYRKILG